MAALPLAQLTQTLGGALGGFRQSANENNRTISQVVKDLGMHFASQKGVLNNLGIAMRSQQGDNQDVARQVTQTNTLLRQSVGLQRDLLTAMKALDKSVKAIKVDGEGSGVEASGIMSRFKGVGALLKGGAIATGGAAALTVGGKAIKNAYNAEAIQGEDDGKSAYKLTIGEGDKKREVSLSEKDIERLAKIARAEAGGKTEGVAGRQAVVDTVLNRLASGNKAWGADGGIRGVINAKKQFSPINGIGDVDKLPTNRELEQYEKEVRDYLAARTKGKSQLGKNYTMFANPSISDPVNQQGWVGAMQRSGSAKQYGRHVHGINPNVSVPNYSIASSGGDNAEPTTASNQAQPQGDAEKAKRMLQQRQAGGRGFTGVNASKLTPEFSNKLNQAIEAAEAATGDKVRITEGYRPASVQAQYYADYKGVPITYQGKTYQPDPSKKGRLAAPPGKSNHQSGNAADLAEGPAREWIRKNASRFGLKDLGAKDMPHFELAGAHSDAQAVSSNDNSSGSDAQPSGATAQAQVTPEQAQALMRRGLGGGMGNMGFGGLAGALGGGLAGLAGAIGSRLGSALSTPAPQAAMVQPEPTATTPATAQVQQNAVQTAAREASAQEAVTRPAPAANVTQVNNHGTGSMRQVQEDPFTGGRHVAAPWSDKLLESYYRNPQGIQTA